MKKPQANLPCLKRTKQDRTEKAFPQREKGLFRAMLRAHFWKNSSETKFLRLLLGSKAFNVKSVGILKFPKLLIDSTPPSGYMFRRR